MTHGRGAEVLESVLKKGVRLWSENGQLRYESPKGALTGEELERLRRSRAQIVALLEVAAVSRTGAPALEHGPSAVRVPLAFSQLWHWQAFELATRRSFRTLAHTIRLQGPLDIDLLQKSVDEIIHRHEALRTRIVMSGGAPTQEVAESGHAALGLDDLTTLPDGMRQDALNLLGVRLFRIGQADHLLIFAMDHLISDAFSMNVLVRDVFGVYAELARGGEVSRSEASVQFGKYSLWQHRARPAFVHRHGAFWSDTLSGLDGCVFPTDRGLPAEGRSGWDMVSLHLDRTVRSELCEWSRLRRTTLVMTVLTAYAALVLRWCNVHEAVVQYHTNGRGRAGADGAIGYFASLLGLRVSLDAENFEDLLTRITESYCEACDRGDISYMASQVTRQRFARTTIFNWVPSGPTCTLPEPDETDGLRIACSAYYSSGVLRQFNWDNDPEIVLFDTGSEIDGRVYFPRNRFSRVSMEGFRRNLLLFLSVLLRDPHERVKDIPLC
jgi:Condensation domain/TubC N-terminal docking domain